MPMDGGAPREIQEGVRQADWSPDGSQLAIIREVGGKDRLEYPIGRVLREVSGFMTDVRFSPKADRIAYFEHPRKWDDRGSLNTVDPTGKNTVISEGYWSARGLAWSPEGDEIFFSASLNGGNYIVFGHVSSAAAAIESLAESC
jgi:Tol biopolymer transport system component